MSLTCLHSLSDIIFSAFRLGLEAFIKHGFKLPDAYYKHFTGNELKDLVKCVLDEKCRSDLYAGLPEEVRNALDALMDFIRAIDPVRHH